MEWKKRISRKSKDIEDWFTAVKTCSKLILDSLFTTRIIIIFRLPLITAKLGIGSPMGLKSTIVSHRSTVCAEEQDNK